MANKEDVEKALIEWGDDVSAAADALGVHRNQVYNWVSRFKIDRAALRARAVAATPRNSVHNSQGRAQLASARTTRREEKGMHIDARKSSGLSGLPLTGRDAEPNFPALPELRSGVGYELVVSEQVLEDLRRYARSR